MQQGSGRASPSTARYEEKEREGCTNRQRSDHVLWAALGLTIYRGEGGGCAPSRVPTPRGAAALDGKGEAAKRGREGAPPRVGLRPI